jgi:hypothetical protein
LLPDVSNAAYAPGPSNQAGHLLFLREGALVAQPFDPGRLELVGELFPVAEQVRVGNVRGSFSVSSNGTVAFESALSGGRRELVWFDREGKRLGAAGKSGAYRRIALSPDKKRVAVERLDANTDIWLLEFAR